MKNVWKGLIIGALTGMVGGSGLDLAAGVRRKAAEVAHDVIDKSPSVAKAAKHKAVDALHGTGVPEAVRGVKHNVGDSPVLTEAKSVVGQVAAGFGH
jgi:hypothetical protein